MPAPLICLISRTATPARFTPAQATPAPAAGFVGALATVQCATLQPVTNMDARTAHAAGRRPTTLHFAILKEMALTDD